MISLYSMVFWASMVTCFIISSVGGTAFGLDDMAGENAGGSDKPRNAEIMISNTAAIVLFGGAIAFYGSICWMFLSLTGLYQVGSQPLCVHRSGGRAANVIELRYWLRGR
eukprot:scaffold2248_cov136-Skeletonema_dohrnii-CCMP3373.AAC.20